MSLYRISSHSILSSVGSDVCIQVLRDVPEGVEQPIQVRYLNEVMGFFLRTLVKMYSKDVLSKEDRSNLKRYLDKIIEAKDAIDGRLPGGRE